MTKPQAALFLAVGVLVVAPLVGVGITVLIGRIADRRSSNA